MKRGDEWEETREKEGPHVFTQSLRRWEPGNGTDEERNPRSIAVLVRNGELI